MPIKIKNNGFTKFLYWLAGGLGAIGLTCTVAAAINAPKPQIENTNQPSEPSEPGIQPTPRPEDPSIVPLTKEVVEQNFAPDGIWADKTFLTAQDLKPYLIQVDSFDYLNKTLDYVEIDPLYDFSVTECIKWPKVNEIKLSSNTLSSFSCFTIWNNILYSLGRHTFTGHYQLTPLTVANRIIPTSSINLASMDKRVIDYCKNDIFMTVNDFFYNAEAFRNVAELNIDSTVPNSVKVATIESNAFYRCNIINKVNINYNPTCILNTCVYIGKNAFSYSSVQSLTIRSDDSIQVLQTAFKNCYQLSNIDIEGGTLSIGDYCFSTNQKVNQRMIRLVANKVEPEPEPEPENPDATEPIPTTTMYTGSNFVAGEYGALSITIIANPQYFRGLPTSFVNINLSDLTNFKISSRNSLEDFYSFGLSDKFTQANYTELLY